MELDKSCLDTMYRTDWKRWNHEINNCKDRLKIINIRVDKSSSERKFPDKTAHVVRRREISLNYKTCFFIDIQKKCLAEMVRIFTDHSPR